MIQQMEVKDRHPSANASPSRAADKGLPSNWFIGGWNFYLSLRSQTEPVVGAIASPSGRWGLSTYNECSYPLANGQPLMQVSNGGIMTFLGQLPQNLLPGCKQPIIDPNMQTVDYYDNFAVGAAHDENAWDNGLLLDSFVAGRE